MKKKFNKGFTYEAGYFVGTLFAKVIKGFLFGVGFGIGFKVAEFITSWGVMYIL